MPDDGGFRHNPSQSRSRKRVAEALDAAERVLAREGYERATLQAIAEEAGLATTSLYRYWKRKQDVLRDISARFLKVGHAQTEEWIDAAASGATLQQTIRAIVKSVIDDYGSAEWMSACLTGLRADAELRMLEMEINKDFSDQFDRLLEALDFQGTKSKRAEVARMITTLIDAFLNEMLRLPIDERARLGREFCRVLEVYLTPQVASRS